MELLFSDHFKNLYIKSKYLLFKFIYVNTCIFFLIPKTTSGLLSKYLFLKKGYNIQYLDRLKIANINLTNAFHLLNYRINTLKIMIPLTLKHLYHFKKHTTLWG